MAKECIQSSVQTFRLFSRNRCRNLESFRAGLNNTERKWKMNTINGNYVTFDYQSLHSVYSCIIFLQDMSFNHIYFPKAGKIDTCYDVYWLTHIVAEEKSNHPPPKKKSMLKYRLQASILHCTYIFLH